MQNTCKCSACGAEFAPDRRNQGRQSYCTRKGCQRERRAVRQRLRRLEAVGKAGLLGSQPGPRRLQAASVISEDAWRPENPIIIGLISMLTGSIDLKEIQLVCQKLRERGTAILSGQSQIGPASIVE
jgi:hypothetical protein